MIIKEYILFSDEQKHQANTVDLEDYLWLRFQEGQREHQKIRTQPKKS